MEGTGLTCTADSVPLTHATRACAAHAHGLSALTSFLYLGKSKPTSHLIVIVGPPLPHIHTLPHLLLSFPCFPWVSDIKPVNYENTEHLNAFVFSFLALLLMICCFSFVWTHFLSKLSHNLETCTNVYNNNNNNNKVRKKGRKKKRKSRSAWLWLYMSGEKSISNMN